MNILNDAIKEAGGIEVVAFACGLSYEAVRKWTKNGLPRACWTGESNWHTHIAALQDKYTAGDILAQPRPKQVKRSQIKNGADNERA